MSNPAQMVITLEDNALVAHFFAQKAQKAIDALWDEGVINEQTIEQ